MNQFNRPLTPQQRMMLDALMENFTASFVHNDICWCYSECDNTDCFRHRSHIIRDGSEQYLTMAELRDDPLCPLNGGPNE